MHYLMSNEYLRKWWNAQKYYSISDEKPDIKTFPVRPFQVRANRQQLQLQQKNNMEFNLKCFQNIPSQIDNSWNKNVGQCPGNCRYIKKHSCIQQNSRARTARKRNCI